MSASTVIRLLGLKPLPVEGGYYRETHRSATRIPGAQLSPPYPDSRSLSTAIYYLLTPDTFSALHRLPGDEVYHFYLGDPVELLLLREGRGERVILGPGLDSGQQVQVCVPGGVWQGSSLVPGGSFALLGTTMAPGFDFADYEQGRRDLLAPAYPAFREQITRLTREGDAGSGGGLA